MQKFKIDGKTIVTNTKKDDKEDPFKLASLFRSAKTREKREVKKSKELKKIQEKWKKE
jgi:hypothetical protein